MSGRDPRLLVHGSQRAMPERALGFRDEAAAPQAFCDRVRSFHGSATHCDARPAIIPGRLVIDGIDLLRGVFVRMEEYSLDAVSREVLGEGKALAGGVDDRIAEINHN